MQKAFLLFLSMLLIALSAQAQTAGCTAGSVAADAPEVRFGVSASYSGPYAAESVEIIRGLELWRDWVNLEQGGINVGGTCHHAALIFQDDKSQVDQTARAVERLIYGEGVHFVFGPYSTELMQTAAAVTEQIPAIIMETGGASERLFQQGFPHVFGMVTPAEAYTATGIEHAFQLGARTAVIIYDDHTLPLAVGARESLDRLGMRTLAFEAVGDDLSAMFTRFRELDPDLFVGSGSVRQFVRTARETAFSPDAFLVTQRFSPEQRDTGYIWGVRQWVNTLRYSDRYFGMAGDYADRFEQAFGTEASSEAAEATVTALALQLAIEAAGTLDTESVRAGLLDLEIGTFFGNVDFDDSGISVNPPMLTVQVQNGVLVPIAPTGSATANTIWPAPNWEER